MLTDFIGEKSRDEREQWVVMGNSIGGLLALMLTEDLQEGRKVCVYGGGGGGGGDGDGDEELSVIAAQRRTAERRGTDLGRPCALVWCGVWCGAAVVPRWWWWWWGWLWLCVVVVV